MKKLQKINLKTASELNSDQMKAIKGGNIQYYCFCGTSSSPTSSVIPIDAPDYNSAMEVMQAICGGEATCFTPYSE
jgi:natural product precursor